MLLIHPPLTKPCEAPASLAYLAGALTAHHIPHRLCDMNIEGLEYLLWSVEAGGDNWSRRAVKNLGRNLEALRSDTTYRNMDRYKRAVADVNRVLEIAGKKHDLQLSLGNYQDHNGSPLNSYDLLQASVDFEKNIFFGYFEKRFGQLLSDDATRTVGFSLNYLSQALCTFALIGYLRASHPELQIVVGGGLATTWLSHPHWKNPFSHLVDHFIAGKGEEPLIKFLGKDCQLSAVRPDFSQLHHYSYLSPGFILPYTSSYGCFWKKCSFCPETSEDSSYSHNPPTQTKEDLRYLSALTGPGLIHMLDNAVSSSTMKSLASQGCGTPWYGFARFDRQLMNREFCFQLRESGCLMLKLGLESGSQQVLESMNKGIDLSMASRILTNLHDAGIGSYVYLLFGTPAEDLATARKTLLFVEEHSSVIDFLNLAIFNLPLCSHEADGLEVSDFYQGDLSIYRNFTHPKGWGRGEVRRFLDTVFKRAPKVAKILRNDPPFFTSNHAPFIYRAQHR